MNFLCDLCDFACGRNAFKKLTTAAIEPLGDGAGGEDAAGGCLDQSPGNTGTITDGKQIFYTGF
jgi:hypothetical protein